MGTRIYDMSTLKHQINVVKHKTTLNKGMGMIAFGAVPPWHRAHKP